jgi:hypothetical protein
MDNIDTSTFSATGAGDGYAISGPGTFTGVTSNPAGCTGNLDYAYPSTDIPAGAARETLARTVLAAYLAGRPVRIFMHGTKCMNSSGALITGGNGVPVYMAVSVQ